MTLWDTFVDIVYRLIFGLGTITVIAIAAIVACWIICMAVLIIRGMINGTNKK